MNFRFNEKLVHISPSVTRRFFELAQKSSGAINFGVGEPSITTPRAIIEAASRSLDEGYTHYSSNYGFTELREKIAEKLVTENHIPAGRDNVMVTCGAAEALYTALVALTNPGDEVVVFEPGFGLYAAVIRMCGAVPTVNYLREEARYSIDFEALEHSVTSRTRGIVLNTPHNPTGTVLSRAELGQVASIAQKHDLWVISDEVYEKVLFGDGNHVSLASLPGMADRTITVNSFSKAYAMTGFRLGYLAAPEAVLDQVLKIHQNAIACANTAAQRAAIVALEKSDTLIAELMEFYGRGLEAFTEGISQVPGINWNPPQGAFYAVVRPTGLRLKGQELAEHLLAEANIVVVPCTSFTSGAYDFIRFSFCIDSGKITEGLARFSTCVRDLQ